MGIKDNPIFLLSRKTWEYSKGNRHKVALYLFMFICANLIFLTEPLIVAKVLNTIQEEGVSYENLSLILLLLSTLVAVTLGFWAFHGPARVIENQNAFLVRANYQKRMLEGTMALPASWHADHHSGDTIDKIQKGSNALFEFSARSFMIVEAIVGTFGAYIALAYFNIHSTYIVLPVMILTILFMIKFDQRLSKQYEEYYKLENKVSAKVYDTIGNITTVTALRMEKIISKSLFQKIMQPLGLYKKNIRLNEKKWFMVSVSGSILFFLVVSSYIISSLNNGVPILIGTVYALYGYIYRINGVFFQLAWIYNDMIREKSAVLNSEEISKEFKEIKKSDKNMLKDLKWEELSMKNLNFSYHTKEGADLHLDNISVSIKRNEKVAFIGASGSGKTTLLRLMREIYIPKSGEIYLDKIPLKEGFKDISQGISFIPQEPELFATTIKENITMGATTDGKKIRKFTDMANFTPVIERLPKRLDSYIFEKGVNLSGGEKQRLALARGLMASEDKQIVLLDEPTSSVDLKNEFAIYSNIFEKFKDKTIISTMHRLHLLPLFDRIYFFRNGKVIVSGTFEEIIQNSPEFRKIWKRHEALIKAKERAK